MKIILSGNVVIAIKPDDFSLASTDTDVGIMPWDGAEPSLGEVFVNGAFIAKWLNMDDAAKLALIRPIRDIKILKTDYVVSRHIEQESRHLPTTLSSEQYNLALAYRQALRDFPATVNLNVDSFETIAWPTKPDFI